MYKKMAGILLAGVIPTVASAQSSVTLYGVTDVFIANFRQGSQNATSMNSGGGMGSRWGLRGVEDLGGGIQAIFVLESGFNVNNGTLGQGGALFGRQAFVGLRSDTLGTLRFGRLQTPGYDWSLNYDAIGLPSVGVLGTLAGGDPRTWAFNPFTDPARVNNGIQYTSPTWHSLTLSAVHSLSGNAGQPINKSYDIDTLTYANGPISASYGFAHSTGTTNTTAATRSVVEHNFGVRYQLPWFSVYGTYQLRKPADSSTDTLWQTGIQVPTGIANSIRFSYGALNNGAKNGTTAQNVNSDARTWAIADVYVISKTTLIYGFFQRLYDSGNSRITIFPPGGVASANVLNSNETAYGIGFQHRF
ncbi:porin [Paraburkholderia sp.]|uniref:porin n=1 Tax=Paraburkholderia sp. TaxID=1926495 RepID=UPI0039E68D6C